ncbi:MAG: hypothetical protein AB2L24_17135 [Mangrovibacterium sp.]
MHRPPWKLRKSSTGMVWLIRPQEAYNRDFSLSLFDNLNISFEGGGTTEMAKRRDIADMDDFGVDEYGYWTDSKSIWGVTPSFGVYARHASDVYFNNVIFQLTHEDKRPPVYCDQRKNFYIRYFNTAVDPNLPLAVFRRSKI